METKVCCVTGHRDIPAERIAYVEQELRREVRAATEAAAQTRARTRQSFTGGKRNIGRPPLHPQTFFLRHYSTPGAPPQGPLGN